MGNYVGEQDSEELEECLLNPTTRNIVQIKVNDVKKSEQLLIDLMGKNVEKRREFILNKEGLNGYY